MSSAPLHAGAPTLLHRRPQASRGRPPAGYRDLCARAREHRLSENKRRGSQGCGRPACAGSRDLAGAGRGVRAPGRHRFSPVGQRDLQIRPLAQLLPSPPRRQKPSGHSRPPGAPRRAHLKNEKSPEHGHTRERPGPLAMTDSPVSVRLPRTCSAVGSGSEPARFSRTGTPSGHLLSGAAVSSSRRSVRLHHGPSSAAASPAPGSTEQGRRGPGLREAAAASPRAWGKPPDASESPGADLEERALRGSGQRRGGQTRRVWTSHTDSRGPQNAMRATVPGAPPLGAGGEGAGKAAREGRGWPPGRAQARHVCPSARPAAQARSSVCCGGLLPITEREGVPNRGRDVLARDSGAGAAGGGSSPGHRAGAPSAGPHRSPRGAASPGPWWRLQVPPALPPDV